MLFKIKSNPLCPLRGALSLSYVPARVTHGAHRHLFFSVSLWNDLKGAAFDGVGLAGFNSRANAFLLA